MHGRLRIRSTTPFQLMAVIRNNQTRSSHVRLVSMQREGKSDLKQKANQISNFLPTSVSGINMSKDF